MNDSAERHNLSSCFLVSVLLTGGIVGVAGQFRGWQFAAYAVYPLCNINRRLSFMNTLSHCKNCYLQSPPSFLNLE